MKTPSWKETQHARIRRQTREFLARGGQIRQVPAGESGMRPDGPRHHQSFSGTPRSERTPLPDVVAAIEARKQASRRKHSSRSAAGKRPTRRLVYDDFGEPLRWVWDNHTR